MEQTLNLQVTTQDFTSGVRAALTKMDIIEQDVGNHLSTDFWTQCVRDTQGKWQSYVNIKSKSGSSYFQGAQASINYNNQLEVDYIKATIKVRKRIYNEMFSIPEMKAIEFEDWLRSLHRDMAYKYVFEGNFPRYVPTHTPIVKEVVMPVAEHYNDPYYRGETNGPTLGSIPQQMLPKDVVEDGLINHYYPEIEYKKEYLNEALTVFREIISHPVVGGKDYLSSVAYLFQLLINLHLFVNINSSLYMNITNALLEIADVQGVEHGILDFVAMRLQPNNFATYFIDQLELE